MLVTFVIVVQDIEDSAENTINSIKSQTCGEYEIVLVLDKMIQDTVKDDYSKRLFWDTPNLKLIFNNSIQGVAVSWSTAIDVAGGKYIIFLNQGDTVSSIFVEEVKNHLNKFEETIDFIEFPLKLTGMQENVVKTYLEKDKLYDLSEDPSPYAFVGNFLFNKLFKTKLLQEFGFKFRRFIRFDMLFFYKVLGQTNNFVYLDTKEPLIEHYLGIVQYSAFDLVNQWTHILNYYRRIGKFKELKDYLNYSYYKTMIDNWLSYIKRYDNKILLKKAANFAMRKFEDKQEEFIQTNKVFLETKDENFKEIINNFNLYIKDIMKSAK